MRPIEEIRAAFHLIHRVATGQSDRAYMSIPARPEHDADLIVSAALDELEELRGRVERLVRERDAAQEQRNTAQADVEWLAARAARAEAAEAKLAKAREALREIMSGLDGEDEDFPGHVYGICRAALSDEEPKPNPAPSAEPPCGGSRCYQGPGGEWIHSSKSYGSCAVRREGWVSPDEAERPREALRELVRVMSHQLARGEDPEEGAFDRAWVAACAALRERVRGEGG